MPASYVLLHSDLGSDEAIIAQAKQILDATDGVEYEIQGVYGVYDIVIKISTENAETLRSIITNQIRKIPKVQSTLTMMIIE